MKCRILIIILFGILPSKSFSQNSTEFRKADYLTFQTGMTVDCYNSLGLRTFFEYQKDLTGNWQYGISYEHSRHFAYAATDHLNELSTNLSLLSGNVYYKLNAIKDRVFWTTGIGLGIVHANWDDYDKIGGTINLSMTLNLKLSKRIYLETSPLIIILPANRFYYSTMNAATYESFYAVNIFPFGLKIKL